MLIPFGDIVKRYGIVPIGVLHVGAHTGEENESYLREGIPQTSIYWVEAIPELASRLSQRLPNVIQAVVSDTVEPVTFNITNFPASSSMLELKDHLYEHPEVTTLFRMSTVSTPLDTLADAHSIRANILNMDIQGAELKCLKGFEKHLPAYDLVYTEVNVKELYANCALLHEMDAWLGERGFDRKELCMTPHGWGDAVYVRRKPVLHLHSRGRGGNQLFQVFGATRLAEETGATLRISFIEGPWAFGDVLTYSPPLADAPTDYELVEPSADAVRSKGTYAFCWWFESWSILKPHLDAVKTLFAFRKPLALVDETIVHLRLGDVQGNLMSIPEYPTYVRTALEGSTGPVVLMSDSLDHPYVHTCQSILQAAYPDRSITIAEPNSDSQDFLRMVQCRHLIGTNSTFVFWAGLLGWMSLPEKKTTVFLSDRMFAPGRTQSLYRADPPSFCSVVEISDA